MPPVPSETLTFSRERTKNTRFSYKLDRAMLLRRAAVSDMWFLSTWKAAAPK